MEREILEETGLHVDVCEEFRRLYDYKVKFSVNKRAVYFGKIYGAACIPLKKAKCWNIGLYRMTKQSIY